MPRLKLRERLTIAYAAILATALFAFGGCAFFAVHAALEAQLDSQLRTTAAALQPIPDVRHGHVVFDPDDRQQFGQLLVENRVNGFALAVGRRILLRSGAPPPAALVDAAGAAARGGTGRYGNDTIAFRVEPIRKDGTTYGAVVAWSSRRFVDDVARTALLALVGATLAVIAFAAAIGRWLSGRLLAPLAGLSALIASIEATDLSERLAWDGPDDELGRLCTTFDRLLDRLEAAFEQQRRFTADASHELRTPLSVMRAEIDLALARERDAGAYVRALERLQAETRRLEALVESLLLAARGDAVGGTADLMDLDDAVRRVIDRMTTSARLAGVVIEREPCPGAWVVSDPPLVESAVLALLDNAIRHSPPGAAVRIALGIADHRVAVSIADCGPGFTSAALREATQRFWRDDAARSGRGSGLGLSIARTIAERFGGALELRNATSGGAVVIFSLPHVSIGTIASLHA